MSLSDTKKELEKIVELISQDLDAKLQFENKISNSSAKSDIFLSCSFLPIEPMLNAFREQRSQYVMQMDYICPVKADTAPDDSNINKIINRFNIDTQFKSSAIIYRPSAVSQWLNKDSKRVAILSIYFQIDEVI